MVQSIRHLNLDFVSGHDLIVCGVELRVGLHTGRAEVTWDLLSLSLSLSLKINK